MLGFSMECACIEQLVMALERRDLAGAHTCCLGREIRRLYRASPLCGANAFETPVMVDY